MKHNFGAFNGDSYSDIVYIKPYGRCATYFLGTTLGILYFEYKNQGNFEELKTRPGSIIFSLIKKSNAAKYLSYFVGISMVSFIVFIRNDYFVNNNWTTLENALYNTFSRPFFITGLIFVMLPLLVGHGKPLQTFLGGSFWTPLARLTYSVYLLHVLIIVWFFFRLRQNFYANNAFLTFIFFAVLIMSHLLAVPFTLLLEVPSLSFEKIFLFPPKPQNANKKELLPN